MIRAAAAAVVVALAAACGTADGTQQPAAERGERLAVSRACASCHSTDGSRKIGPTWKGLHGSEVPLESGETVVADDEYLAESIRDPDAKTVKGYPRGVMSNVIRPGSIPEDEIQALVAYIRSLR